MEDENMKKEYFTINGRKYRAPWIIARLAPVAIVAGQMVLVVGVAVAMFIITYGLQ